MSRRVFRSGATVAAAVAMALTSCSSTTAGPGAGSTAAPSVITTLVASLVAGTRKADGFTGTLEQVTPAATGDLEFRANGGATEDGAPAVAAVDLSSTSSMDTSVLDVRRVDADGPLFVGPAATVRSIVGREAAGSAGWLMVDAADPPGIAGHYASARQGVDLADPYRYLALAARATALENVSAAGGVSKVRLTLSGPDVRAAFPHIVSGVPTLPDTVTADLTYDPARQTLQRMEITMTDTDASSGATRVWQLFHTITSTTAVEILGIDDDEYVVAAAVG